MGIESVEWSRKRTDLSSDEPARDLLECRFRTPGEFSRATRLLERHPSVRALFNSDLLPVQLYLFQSLQIEPTSKVEVTYDVDMRLRSIERTTDEDQYELKPPPFSTFYFDVHPETRCLSPTPFRDAIKTVELVYRNRATGEERQEVISEGGEQKILETLQELIREEDPDFLFVPEADEFVLPYVKTRAGKLGIPLDLGREHSGYISPRVKKMGLYVCPGRVCLDFSNYGYTFDDSGWGIAGLVERCRFACLPPSIAGRWTANRVNDSRVCYELMKRGHVIPTNRGAYEFVRPLDQIYARDKGGMIFSPKIREVHHNVAEIDFDSLYPNLIVSRNISFETIVPDGKLHFEEEGILPFVTRDTLQRRLYFKKLKKEFENGSQEWTWCEQRQAALKLVLVCIYGTSGCCWNRFGNVLAFEQINWEAREVLIKAKDYAQSRGFEVIKGHTDSLFVKKERASRSDYEQLARHISEHVGLPMSLDHHYKFLMLLPQQGEADYDKIEAMTEYFGLLYSGEALARGIEIRRHDTPKFIKEFQLQLIHTLFSPDTVEEVLKQGYENCLNLVTREIDRVMSGDLALEDLVVSKILRKPLKSYKSLLPHVTTGLQLAANGKLVKAGETIDFVYKDANHMNPLCRTLPRELSFSTNKNNGKGGGGYDREKYRDLLLDAAETILGSLGFSRKLYGYEKNESLNWLKNLYEDRRNEALREVSFEENPRRRVS